MKKRLPKVLGWFGGGLVAILLAGFAEMPFGSRWIFTSLEYAVNAPIVAAAFASGSTGGCGREAYDASLRFLKLRGEQMKLRNASKQLKSDAAGLDRWQTPRGEFWTPVQTDLFFVLAEQVVDVYQGAHHKVRKGDVVLDCGANVGVFTRTALDQGASKVIAIDPVPDNVAGMKRTFAKEIAEGRVIVAPVGVWNKDDVLKMTIFENSALDSFVMKERTEAAAAKEVELPLTTIDKLVEKYGLERVDFIKMDIEGAERQALEGGKGAIQRFRPRMSVATENLDDDYIAVPKKIKEIDPAYASACGPCRVAGFASMRPDIMFFSPQPTVAGRR